MKKGFTLIELLVVIAILGILSAGILTAINVTSNLDKAKLAKAKTFSKSLENALSVAQVGKWSFEDSSSLGKDTSGNNNNGSVVGATWLDSNTCGLGFGGCLEFDGLTGHIYNIPSEPFKYKGGDLTLSAWINRNSGETDEGFIISKPWNGSGNYNYWLSVTPNNIQFRLQGNSVWYASISRNIPANEWTHITATVASTKAVRIYVNGNSFYSNDHGISGWDSIPSGDAGTPLAIGCIFPYGSCTSASYAFKGKIDEVAIYNQSLSASQIHQLYAQGLPRHQLAKR